MKLIKQVDSRAVSVEVEGYQPIPIQRPYVMHPTGMLVPARVDMRWENEELVKLTVSGRKLRKDSTVGIAESTTVFVFHGNQQQKIWPWLTTIVVTYTPMGAPWPKLATN